MSATVRTATTFLIGIVLFAGLPILSWGVTDLANFAASPTRLGYVVLVILLQAVVAIKFPHTGQNQGEGKKTVERQRIAVLLLQLFSLVIIIVAPYTDRRSIATLSELEFLRYPGLVLFALGFIAVNWAEATLGKQFSIQVTIQEDHQLVTQGLYRFVRHPRYLGIISFNLGIALIYRSWLALIFVVALALVLLWRIQDEETLMQQEFGADWEAYSKKSWRLIPYIY
jgi:protein-S-isoprenylcysteine O-methyltransferase Ste14